MKNYKDILINRFNLPVDNSWDEEMFHLLVALNTLGMKTKYHCIGHEDGDMTYVMFDDSAPDDLLLLLVRLFSPYAEKEQGELYLPIKGIKLYKWARHVKGGGLGVNWMLEIHPYKPYGTFYLSDRKKIVENMANFLDNIGLM